MPNPSEFLKRVSVIVITGGSSGIGCSIIKAIRSVNSDLIICNLSRSKPAGNFGEKTHHFGCDLTDSAGLASAFDSIFDVIKGAPDGEIVLINNSGFGDYGRFQDADRGKQLAIIDLNVRAVVDLTSRMLPLILPRGGAVVSIASTAGFQPTPFLATYGASKAFVLNWALALNEDLHGTKVRSLAVCPGPTRSNFFKAAGFAKPPMNEGVNKGLDMSSEEVAAHTLQALADGKSLIVTGWKNKLITFFGRGAPLRMVNRIGGIILRKMRLEQHKKHDE